MYEQSHAAAQTGKKNIDERNESSIRLTSLLLNVEFSHATKTSCVAPIMDTQIWSQPVSLKNHYSQIIAMLNIS